MSKQLVNVLTSKSGCYAYEDRLLLEVQNEAEFLRKIEDLRRELTNNYYRHRDNIKEYFKQSVQF